MNFIKIEKNVSIPVPKPNVRTGTFIGEVREALVKMEMGDSFLVAENQKVSVYAEARKFSIKLCSRRENKGFRIWKMSPKV